MQKFVILTLTLMISQDFAWAEPKHVEVEASAICVDCKTDQIGLLKKQAEAIEATLKNKKNICDEKGIIDTKRQALINKWLPSKTEPEILDYIFRQSVSCLYGLGEGGVQSVLSLVKGVADLAGEAYNSGKSVVQFFKEKKAGDVLDSIDLKKLTARVTQTTGQAFNSITESIGKMAQSVKKTYQELGTNGALSMIGFELWQKSPHHVLKNFIKKAIDSLGGFLSRESTRFNCLDNESKAELMCKLIGSVGTDIAVGSGIAKLILWGKRSFLFS